MKRYDFIATADGGETREEEDGEWVRYEDAVDAQPVQPADKGMKMTSALLQGALDALEEHQYARTDKALNMGLTAINALRAAIAHPVQPLGPRPKFGAIGSRDVDVADAQIAWDAAQPVQPADEALRRDAERYRWLRERIPGSDWRIAGVIYAGGVSVDAQIDAAMQPAP